MKWKPKGNGEEDGRGQWYISKQIDYQRVYEKQNKTVEVDGIERSLGELIVNPQS